MVAGCSITPDVQNGIILHTILFFDDDRPEARKRINKWVDFIKQRAKWEPTRNSSVCSKHFTEDDSITHSQLKSAIEIEEIETIEVSSIACSMFPAKPFITRGQKSKNSACNVLLLYFYSHLNRSG